MQLNSIRKIKYITYKILLKSYPFKKTKEIREGKERILVHGFYLFLIAYMYSIY